MAVARLKASWQIRTGIVPGRADESHLIHYTSDEYEADNLVPDDAKTNRFTELMLEAHEYAKQKTDPARTNWVELIFIWY